jgi:hypothetical protein
MVFQEIDAMAYGAVSQAEFISGARKALQPGDSLECCQRM